MYTRILIRLNYVSAEVFNRVVTQLFVGEMSQKFGLIISNLWNDPNTKQAYELLIARPKTHAASPLENTVLDSAEYFLESIDRLSAPDYIPSDEDLLRYYFTCLLSQRNQNNIRNILLFNILFQ